MRTTYEISECIEKLCSVNKEYISDFDLDLFMQHLKSGENVKLAMITQNLLYKPEGYSLEKPIEALIGITEGRIVVMYTKTGGSKCTDYSIDSLKERKVDNSIVDGLYFAFKNGTRLSIGLNEYQMKPSDVDKALGGEDRLADYQKKKNIDKICYIGSGIVLAFFLIYAFICIAGSPKTSSSKSNGSSDYYGHDKFDAFVIAKKAVKEHLKSPSTAEFCSTSQATITYSGKTWTVKGWVDAQNSFGATLRNNFTVKFTFISSDKYTIDYCDIS